MIAERESGSTPSRPISCHRDVRGIPSSLERHWMRKEKTLEYKSHGSTCVFERRFTDSYNCSSLLFFFFLFTSPPARRVTPSALSLTPLSHLSRWETLFRECGPEPRHDRRADHPPRLVVMWPSSTTYLTARCGSGLDPTKTLSAGRWLVS